VIRIDILNLKDFLYNTNTSSNTASPIPRSGIPRPIFQYAPPPITPENPTTTHACCFAVSTRLHHLR